MGFRFRKIISVIPGVKVNLSKSGASTSIGGHGATVNGRLEIVDPSLHINGRVDFGFSP